MAIFSSLFRSSQVRDCETALRLLRPSFADALFYGLIHEQVQRLIRQNPELVQKKILLEGQTPQEIVLHAIANSSFRECSSGRNHTYRGILSMEGSSFRQVFAIATEKLLEIGAIDEETANINRAELTVAIKEAG